MNNRMAFEIKMTPEKLQEICQYVKNAQEHMMEGQTFRVEIFHNIDFVFHGLKPFKVPTGSSREPELLKDNSGLQ